MEMMDCSFMQVEIKCNVNWNKYESLLNAGNFVLATITEKHKNSKLA